MVLNRRFMAILAASAALTLVAAGCGGDGDDGGESASGEPITIGYSAWPGWFPWAIAEEKGFFEDEGVNVELTFFSDYVTSLDAMVAGQLDGNTQTLNDTMAGVATGSEQVVVLTNDNSTGNDAIIVDESINSIEDLKGKTVAAEAGVVDHFLLLQGLESVGLTEDDIDFRGVLTDAAAAGFSGGQFDAVGVFAPFTLTALERPGSKVLFSSADFPGTISDHLVVTPELIADRPDDVQKMVNAWYRTLEFIEENEAEALEIMAAKAEVSVDEYKEFAEGTTIFDAETALASFEEGEDTTSLRFTARLINPFLVSSGLAETEADLDGLFDPSFTKAYMDSQ